MCVLTVTCYFLDFPFIMDLDGLRYLRPFFHNYFNLVSLVLIVLVLPSGVSL